MAISNIGFAGPVDVQDWYKLTRATNSIYGVADSSELVVSVKAGADRTVAISPGNAWGRGVFTTSTATESVTLPAAPSSGSRWDMVVLRRDWNTKTATFTYVKGTSTKALPTRNTAVGTLDDQPLVLARVEAGKSAVQEIVDLKCWAGNAGLVIRDRLAMNYLEVAGTRVVIGNEEYFYGTTNSWGRRAGNYDSDWVPGTVKGGWNGSGSYCWCRKVSIGPIFLVEVRIRTKRTGSRVDIFSNGNVADTVVAQLPSGFGPDGVSASLQSGVGSRTANGYVGGNGQVILATVAAGYNDQYIEKDDDISLSGIYFTNA